MRFWDASALVPLLVEEPLTKEVQRLYGNDPTLLVWWGTEVEAASAIARLERMGLPKEAGAVARERLEILRSRWQEVPPVRFVRFKALELLQAHSLRSADALQLAAALVIAGTERSKLEFVCLDGKLFDAANAEGLAVIGRAALESDKSAESQEQ